MCNIIQTFATQTKLQDANIGSEKYGLYGGDEGLS